MRATLDVMIPAVSSDEPARRRRSVGQPRVAAKRMTKLIALLLAMTMAPWLAPTSAHAQSMNTYVSGKGNDGNPCSSNQPCKTLQGALTKTAAGGQINALDSANYGYVTINHAVSIVSAEQRHWCAGRKQRQRHHHQCRSE